jgi:hypothetical protein
VDYRIRRAKSDLDSTAYIEIAAGKYTGERWREGSLFVSDDAFTAVEGVVARHFPDYEHSATNDIPKEVGHRIIAEWREIAEWMPVMKPDEVRVALNVATWFGASFDEQITNQRADFIGLLRGLADGCDELYSRGEWLCVLGA